MKTIVPLNLNKKKKYQLKSATTGILIFIGTLLPAVKLDQRYARAWLVSKLDKAILIERLVLDSILGYARMLHPREAILLLKGKSDKHRIVINDTWIPPLAIRGNTFSTFPLHMLPIDFSTIGVAHSHPTGTLRPSVTDLNKFYGRIMVITAYPYRSEKNIAIFDREGKPLKFEIV